MRADTFLVEHGHASTRSQAQRLIASGVEWRVGAPAPWKKVIKNGDEIPSGAEVRLLDQAEARFVSRGGLKLEGALRQLGLSVQGLRCLDVGQSTGGFTDCLLSQGAQQVVGVDVGHGQLHSQLRADARVVCIEGLNARALTPALLAEAWEEALSELVEEEEDNDTLPEAPYAWMRNGGVVDDDYDDSDDAKEHEIEDFKAQRAARAKAEATGTLPRERRRKPEFADARIDTVFDLVTGDLSFISLTLVLPALVPLVAPGGQLVLLVKPQFELQPGQVGKGGLVKDESLYAVVQERLRSACAEAGLQVQAWIDSPIAGGDGNREFFIHARRAA
ncbi:TlyA family RNA methyltransferase [Ideonella livida]|uniref:TlyA family RNA methyltransferase n=1 Tax=Ideonella livida TaxID=2707176 RepID=A0A7C9PJF7_9BURK|nr:TlyA family RNA methyltransferase [Ideonella livida]NDY92614.1 TlyA family RNA methyltransferase [Ideonella livida]